MIFWCVSLNKFFYEINFLFFKKKILYAFKNAFIKNIFFLKFKYRLKFGQIVCCGLPSASLLIESARQKAPQTKHICKTTRDNREEEGIYHMAMT